MNCYVDDFIIKKFLGFYYGYVEQVFVIKERSEFEVKFAFVTQNMIELDALERK